MTDADDLKPGWLYSINDIAKPDWQALFDNGYPFCSQAFLAALEQGGSVDSNSSWQSQHLAVWQGEQLVALGRVDVCCLFLQLFGWCLYKAELVM
ncbi:MAG: peptidogalycan biosysnthesis protein, partial [Alishewanella aestuarii]